MLGINEILVSKHDIAALKVKHGSLIEAVCCDGLNNALPWFNDLFPC